MTCVHAWLDHSIGNGPGMDLVNSSVRIKRPIIMTILSAWKFSSAIFKTLDSLYQPATTCMHIATDVLNIWTAIPYLLLCSARYVYYTASCGKNSPGSRPVAMLEAVLRRLVLVVDTVDTVDTVDMVDSVPFGPEAAPRVVGRLAVGRLAAVHKRLTVHRKEEAQSAGLQVPNLERTSLRTRGVPSYRSRRL